MISSMKDACFGFVAAATEERGTVQLQADRTKQNCFYKNHCLGGDNCALTAEQQKIHDVTQGELNAENSDQKTKCRYGDVDQNADREDESENAHTLTNVCLSRRYPTSASCIVRVLPRFHEMKSDFRCSEPADSPEQNHEMTTTNSWPQQQATRQHKPQRMFPIMITPIGPNKVDSSSREKQSSDTMVNDGTTPSDNDVSHIELLNSANTSMLPLTPSLLERIVTTHPVWFLPHFGRTAAGQLLKAMPVGVFMVRGSSRSSTTQSEISPSLRHATGRVNAMALSVRLPNSKNSRKNTSTLNGGGTTSTAVVDHYLIESVTIGGIGVRLEGSPFKFKSLPLLLLHYCVHGEELRTCLRLPSTIEECMSLRDLKDVALFGQEFWVNEIAKQTTTPIARRNPHGYLTKSKSNYSFQHQQPEAGTQQQQLAITDNNNNNNYCCDHNLQDKCDVEAIIENEMFESQKRAWQRQQQEIAQHYEQQINLKRTKTPEQTAKTPKRMPLMHDSTQQKQHLQAQQQHCCCNCSTENDNYYLPSIFYTNNIPLPHEKEQRRLPSVPSMSSRNDNKVPLRTGDKHESKANKPVVSGQSCWYVNPAPKLRQLEQQCHHWPQTSGDYQEFAVVQPRHFGFLKKSCSAMESIDYDSQPSVSSQSSSLKSKSKKSLGEAPPSGASSTTSSSKGTSFLKNLFSASNSNLTKHNANNAGGGWQFTDSDDYFIPPQSVMYGGDTLVSRDNSMTRRAKTLARRILPSFGNNAEPLNSNNVVNNKNNKSVWRRKGANSQEDSSRALSDETIRARQLAFKRRNTDIDGKSLRLAQQGLLHADSSPRDFLRKSLGGRHGNEDLAIELNDEARIHHNQKIRDNNNENEQRNYREQQYKPKAEGGDQLPDGKRNVLAAPSERMNENVTQKCIDELRRKRLEPEAYQNVDADENPTRRVPTVVLRRNKLRASRDGEQNRRSVPDVNALMAGETTNTSQNNGSDTSVLRRKRYEGGAQAKECDSESKDPLHPNSTTPNERTVVVVDACLISELDGSTSNTRNSASPVARQDHTPPKIDTLTERRSPEKSNTRDENRKMKALVIVQHQVEPSCSDNSAYAVTPQQQKLVDGEWLDSQQKQSMTTEAIISDASVPPPTIFRHSTRLARFSTQSPQRYSKVATVRPQQHMILNSSSSSEGGSPPETVKSRLRHRSAALDEKKRSSSNLKKPSADTITCKVQYSSTDKEDMPAVDDILQRPPVLTQTPPTSASSSAVFHTANNEDSRSPLVRHPSDYAQINDLQQYFADDDDNDARNSRTPTKNNISSGNLEVPFANDDDAVSVAGTDFNEPWDSNAWNNLLDLARFGDEKPTTAIAIKALHSAETIFEEDDLSSSENLTLRDPLHYDDYYENEALASVLGDYQFTDEKFDSLPRSLYSGGSARGGSATGACARHHPPHVRQNSSHQLQQYLNIIPERDSVEFGTDTTSTVPGSGRKSHGNSTLRSQRGSVNVGDKPTSAGDRKEDSSVNVEMEAAAMAAVLGSCGPRPNCVGDDDGRMSAAAKFAVTSSAPPFSLRPADDNWRQQRNRTFHVVEDRENRPTADNLEQQRIVDALNNNGKTSNADSMHKLEETPQRKKVAGARFPPHRLKSSSSFSTPLAASHAANKNSATSVTTATLKMFGGGTSSSESSSLCTNSYSRRRGANYGNYEQRDTQSLHRMAHQDDLNCSLNNLSMRLPSLSPIIAQPRFRKSHSQEAEPSAVLQRYVEQLASDEATLFGGTLHKFIECTVESEETDPHIVIRRVRQFLNGMKNYLVKNGQGGLHALIERESAKLNANEFLNIDAIFETVLTKIVLVPIKGHLYHLMVFENTRNGQLQRLSENLSAVRAMDPIELGFVAGTAMPNSQTMEQVRAYLRRMQNHYSPLKKLENLLKALSLAVSCSLAVASSTSTSSGFHLSPSGDCGTFDGGSYAPPMRSQSGDMLMEYSGNGTIDSRTTSSSAYRHAPTSSSTPLGTRHGPSEQQFVKASNKHQSTERLTAKVDASGAVTISTMAKRLPGEELIRWLVYLLAKSSAINCEIEAWYMWELLPQQLLTNGEAAYYLSMLFSAVNILKNPDSIRRLNTQQHQADFNLTGSLSTLQDNGSTSPESSDAFLRIAVPNEHEGSISYHTFPVLPQMNVMKLCRVIAHQFAITNSEDYGLYVLYDSYETILLPKEYPQAIHDRLIEERKTHLFAYKRRDTRIAWPKNAYVCCLPAEFQSRVP